MNIITRNNLIELLKDGNIINDNNGFFLNDIDLKHSKESHIQQCSVSLHIGSIFIPETKDNERGGKNNPIYDEYLLKTGQTALIQSKEKICLPSNIAGICLSPSRTTLRGLLIVNTGLVDPGYNGHLHFTVINMGKDSFLLRHQEIICKQILIQLEEHTPSYKGITGQTNEVVSLAVKRNLHKLSKDFLDVDKRAEEASKSAIKHTHLWTLITPIIVAVILTLPSLFQWWFDSKIEKRFLNIDRKIQELEFDNKKEDEILEKIKKLEKELKINHKQLFRP